MRLLVTGGAGFIGSEIVAAAIERGWDIRVLDSLREDVHGNTAVRRSNSPRPGGPVPVHTGTTPHAGTLGGNPQLDFLRGDVRDAVVVTRALEGVDVVCHQAAKVGLGVDISDSPDYVSSNDLGTAILLAGMAEEGVSRLVIASSMVVYGEGAYRGSSGLTRPAPRRIEDLDAGLFDPRGDDGDVLVPELISEDAPLDPRNVYAITKLTQEYLATSWARSTGGVVAALRYHNVYGPGMPQNTPYAGVASLFRSSIERGEAPRVFEDGAQRRDFVHVRDVASANLAALDWTATMPEGTARAFNVGSGTVHTIGEMAARLSTQSGGAAPIVTGEYRLGDVRHITASSARIRSELGWEATVSFEAGMHEFATAPLRPPAR